MRVWVDVTNSPHVPFFRPLIGLLRERGHEVDITARAFAQTVELLEDAGLRFDVVGPPHAGASRIRKSLAMVSRLRALRAFARGRGHALVLSHASHEAQVAARSLGIPSAYAFDYEYALAQHRIGCHAATRVVVPDAIPQAPLDRVGARERKVRRYEGLKEEYYLHGFTPNAAIVDELGVDRSRLLVVVRTPPDTALYHRHGSPLFTDVIDRLAADTTAQTVVLPRTNEQRATLADIGGGSLVVPERAVDAQSLVALADLVVSAGGTMNREAVALGTPVYTTFAGRVGAVDERLLEEGRLRRLESADDLLLERKPPRGAPVTRDPSVLLDLMLSALER